VGFRKIIWDFDDACLNVPINEDGIFGGLWLEPHISPRMNQTFFRSGPKIPAIKATKQRVINIAINIKIIYLFPENIITL
jgi:hypothetical protein